MQHQFKSSQNYEYLVTHGGFPVPCDLAREQTPLHNGNEQQHRAGTWAPVIGCTAALSATDKPEAAGSHTATNFINPTAL